MIVSDIASFARYTCLNRHFGKVLDFLEKRDLLSLPEGKTEIDGDNVYCMRFDYVAENVLGTQFEAHRKYLDIHLVLENEEFVGTAALKGASLVKLYDEAADIAFYAAKSYQAIKLVKGRVLVVFSDDLHQPGVKSNDLPVKKLVIKVKEDTRHV